MNFSNITWLDDKGHIKPPIFLYLIIVFLARGWCVFIASLTQFNDQAGLVRLFYPEKSDFILALISGAGALLVYGLVISERKRSPLWLQPIFKYLPVLLWLLLIVDALMLGQRLVHDFFVFNTNYAIDALIIFWSSLYLFKSKRLKYYTQDWVIVPAADNELPKHKPALDGMLKAKHASDISVVRAVKERKKY